MGKSKIVRTAVVPSIRLRDLGGSLATHSYLQVYVCFVPTEQVLEKMCLDMSQ